MVGGRAAQRGAGRLERVGHDAQVAHVAAQAFEQARAARSGWSCRCRPAAAARRAATSSSPVKNRATAAGDRPAARQPDRGRQAEVAAGQPDAGRQNCRAGRMSSPARRMYSPGCGTWLMTTTASPSLALLLHHHRVGAGRHRRAGEDARRRAGLQRCAPTVPAGMRWETGRRRPQRARRRSARHSRPWRCCRAAARRASNCCGSASTRPAAAESGTADFGDRLAPRRAASPALRRDESMAFLQFEGVDRKVAIAPTSLRSSTRQAGLDRLSVATATMCASGNSGGLPLAAR